jgi:hypothetical protein
MCFLYVCFFFEFLNRLDLRAPFNRSLIEKPTVCVEKYILNETKRKCNTRVIQLEN